MRKLKKGFKREKKIPKVPSSSYQVPENHLDWNTLGSHHTPPPHTSSWEWSLALGQSYDSSVMKSNHAGHCQQRPAELIKKLCLVVSTLISARYADPPVKSRHRQSQAEPVEQETKKTVMPESRPCAQAELSAWETSPPEAFFAVPLTVSTLPWGGRDGGGKERGLSIS